MNVNLRQLLGALALAVLLPAAAGADERYGYVRTLQGGASIASTESSAQAAEVNQPVMTGDRVLVSDRSRIELELSDRTLARLDGGSDLTLVRSAFSADAQDRSTLLRLDVGDLQLQVTEDALGDELARIDTANATFYVSEPGLYRVRTDGDGWTEVTVRSGALDVRTETESITLAAGRSLRVDGAEFPRLAEFDTPAEDDFDLWGRELDGQVEQADLRYVEPEMRYTTSSLDQYGDWVNVGSRYAWHPGSVGADWRPYWDGRWGYTPSGLTWISNEPWGWSTYHYGSWDYAPAYGWVWYPGVQYSPAWVYWYWGPSYAAWCPSGYYSRYYGAYGYRYGVYGWAGGGWDGFANWSFVPTRYFGHRNLRDYSHPGAYYRDRYGLRDVPRGIITTDTRPITPNRWDRPTEVIDALQRVRFDSGDRLARKIPDLPDVSSFVSRRGDLDPQVGARIAELPPATDVAVARRIPKDRGDVVQRVPPTDRISTAKPRFESPQDAGPRRIGVPRDNDASPRRGGPTVEAAPRTQPRVTAQPRTVAPDGGQLPNDIRPRRLPPAEPSVTSGNRQGWRQTQPGSQPRAYVPREAGQPRPGAQPRAYVPEKGGQPQDLRSIYAQPAPRGSGGPSTDTPVVRRVIDGVRNVPPRPTPYVSPAPQAQPRYQAQPARGPSQPAAAPSARGGENGRARGSGSGSHSREAAPRDNGHGQDKHAEDRKPPQRDHDR